jgi:hypothetical protein
MMTQDNSKPACRKLALSRVEAAEALGVSPVTLDRLAQRGLLKPSRAIRRPLYPIWEIERFLRETAESIELSKDRAA